LERNMGDKKMPAWGKKAGRLKCTFGGGEEKRSLEALKDFLLHPLGNDSRETPPTRRE